MEFVHILLNCILVEHVSVYNQFCFTDFTQTRTIITHSQQCLQEVLGLFTVQSFFFRKFFFQFCIKSYPKLKKILYLYIRFLCMCFRFRFQGVGVSHPLKTSCILNLHSKIIGLGPPPLPRQTQLSLKHPSLLRKIFPMYII